jgi:2-amino-4-hydroxy-6-hydroxymethyldihydropteridine diphosphokinase
VSFSESRVLLLLGSNVDADAKLNAALRALESEFAVVACSRRHPSPASGADDAPAYLNQAVLIQCSLDRQPLKLRLRAIEARLGRTRPAADPRLCPIDIDAVGRVDGRLAVWDSKAFGASYAQTPVAEVLANELS